MNKVLYIIRGLPGAGKSTLGKKIAEACFSADDYFTDERGNYNFNKERIGDAHRYCQGAVNTAMLIQMKEIAVANTFTRKSEMEAYYQLAEKYGYSVVEITMKSPFQNIHNVPEEVIKNMKDRFEY